MACMNIYRRKEAEALLLQSCVCVCVCVCVFADLVQQRCGRGLTHIQRYESHAHKYEKWRALTLLQNSGGIQAAHYLYAGERPLNVWERVRARHTPSNVLGQIIIDVIGCLCARVVRV
jgi:hypothetical protein